MSGLVGDQAESAVPASHLVLEMRPPAQSSSLRGQDDRRDKQLALGLGKPEE